MVLNILLMTLVLFLFCWLVYHLNLSVTKSLISGKNAILLLIITLCWLTFLYFLTTTVFIKDFYSFPPHMLAVVLPPLITIIYFIFKGHADGFIQSIDQKSLIGFQSFRIAMELILLQLSINGLWNRRLTFEGFNFDIVIGISAIVFYLLLKEKKTGNRFILGWNIAGLLFLINIVVLAVLSTPYPFAVYTDEPINRIVFDFPFILLPGFIVPMAYTVHLLSIRKCMLEKI